MILPKAFKIFFLHSLKKYSNYYLTQNINLFCDINGDVVIQENNIYPLDLTYFYRDGIAFFHKKDIKNYVIDFNKKYLDLDEKNFVQIAIINELIYRNLLQEEFSD